MSDVQFDPDTGEILEDAPAAAPPPKPVRKKAAKKKAVGNGRTPPPADETPRQKFERVANVRIQSVANSLRILRKLGQAQRNYDYGDLDVDRIRDALQAALDDTIARMKRDTAPRQIKLFG